MQPTQVSNGTSSAFTLLGLASSGVYLADAITAAAGGLLHHHFTLTTINSSNLFSVALCHRVAPPGR